MTVAQERIATNGRADAAIRDVLARTADLADRLAEGAAALDHEGARPVEALRQVAESGLLAAPLAVAHGGAGMGTDLGRTAPLLLLLKGLGRGNLAIGRIYEGHVNALMLIEQFGTREQAAMYAAAARDERRLFGVWNTEAQDGVHVVPAGLGRFRLEGSKTFASGAGLVDRPLVTGALPDGRWQMCVVPMECVRVAIDPSWWRPIGMHASASYRVDFGGVELGPDDLLGAPGDYYQDPWFRGGAIRFAAVQLGGAEALLDAACTELRAAGRDADPYQRARIGEAAIAVEGGALWLRAAAEVADRYLAEPGPHPSAPDAAESVVAYANMTRLAVERACLEVMQLVERSVGARGLLRPHPIERIVRDLTLYLRQPAPDAALADIGRYAFASPPPTASLWKRDERSAQRASEMGEGGDE